MQSRWFLSLSLSGLYDSAAATCAVLYMRVEVIVIVLAGHRQVDTQSVRQILNRIMYTSSSADWLADWLAVTANVIRPHLSWSHLLYSPVMTIIIIIIIISYRSSRLDWVMIRLLLDVLLWFLLLFIGTAIMMIIIYMCRWIVNDWQCMIIHSIFLHSFIHS